MNAAPTLNPEITNVDFDPDRLGAIKLSFVVPVYNESENIVALVDSIACESKQLKFEPEIIFVDDGSTDDSFAIMSRMQEGYPIRLVRLSRNFGKEQAIMAGLNRASGKAVVVMDADLQEPLSRLEDMLYHYRAGYDVVFAIQSLRCAESLTKRFMTNLFYKVMQFGSEVEIPTNVRDFRLMDRKVVKVLCNLPEYNRFMKGLYSWVGFKTKAIPIVLNPRIKGQSSFGMLKLFRHGFTGLAAFSNWPLRIWIMLGMAIAIASISYGAWVLTKTLLFGNDVPGYTTLAVTLFFLNGVLLISIGILGEYIARIYAEVKRRPGYIVDVDLPTSCVDGNDKNNSATDLG